MPSFAGAYGAQRIAERSKKRDELLKEIRAVNAAISLTFSICNYFLALKKQHIKKLWEDFIDQKNSVIAHIEQVRRGQIAPGTIYTFQADLQTLSMPKIPIDLLQDHIFEKLSLTGRALNLNTALSETAHSLSNSLENRNQLIQSYKDRTTPITKEEYFGLPNNGSINEDYPTTLSAIYDQTNHGIFFSQLLCADLAHHGNKLATQFKKTFRDTPPIITEVNFQKAIDAGLMPDEKDYVHWTSAFTQKP